MKVTPIIGLEAHVELKTLSKMFCSCDASHFHAQPNTHTCPVCLGLPGALPVPNYIACEWNIKLGLALNCSINKYSFFERKNYFYPDLPKGYQITQLQAPFAINGYLDIDSEHIRINRAHMEEDTGKSQHTVVDMQDMTLIDFNRSGVPLVEIVSEPDIHGSAVAKKYLIKLQQIIRYLGISDADIEKGSMRCEPTINLEIITDNGQTVYTPLAEIKNVASLSGVEMAIEYEIKRQLLEWQKSGITKTKTNKTTRGWDADKLQTFLQREKEGSADYRYFPEPDIPPLEFTDEQITKIKQSIPELPDAKKQRYIKDFGLSEYDATVISEDKYFSDIYESVLNEGINLLLEDRKEYAKFIANIFLGPIKSYLNETQTVLNLEKVPQKSLLELFNSFRKSEISSTVIKQVIVESYQNGKPAMLIAKEKGLLQVSDTSKLEDFAKQVIDANPQAVIDYQKNPNSIGFLIGQLMKISGGAANPKMAREILEKVLTKGLE